MGAPDEAVHQLGDEDRMPHQDEAGTAGGDEEPDLQRWIIDVPYAGWECP